MNRNPTKEGRMVDARDFVKIGVLSFSAWDRLGKAVKNGPIVVKPEVQIRLDARRNGHNGYLSRTTAATVSMWGSSRYPARNLSRFRLLSPSDSLFDVVVGWIQSDPITFLPYENRGLHCYRLSEISGCPVVSPQFTLHFPIYNRNQLLS